MRFRRRSAISYIMSVAIMTFVTLAMASVVLVWSLGQTATSQNTFASAINANEAKAEERYTIEQVQFFAPSFSSTTGTSASTTLVDSGTPSWTTNQWQNFVVAVTSGTAAGETATICSNTNAAPFTLSITTGSSCSSPTGWAIIPPSGSQYSTSSAPTGGYVCASPGGCLVIYIRNVGSIQLVCDAVYINNQLALQTQYKVGGTGTLAPTGGAAVGRLSLGIQQLGSIAVPAPFPLSAGTTYTISASTTRGNVVTVVQTY